MFFSETRCVLVFCLLLTLVIPGCRRRETPAPGAIAVLPFENLSGDHRADWMGTALAAVARYQLAGGTRVMAAATTGDAIATGAVEVISGYYIAREGAVQVYSFVERPSARQVRPVVEGTYTPDTLVAAATAISRSAGIRRLRMFPEARAVALRDWSEAGGRKDPQAGVELLEQAIEADPGFGPAYLELLRLKSAMGDQEGVRRILAKARRAKLGDAEEAQIGFRAALGAGEQANLDRATSAVLEYCGDDAEKLLELGAEAYRSRAFTSSARLYWQAARLNPKNSAAWNQLTYAEAFAGNKSGAERAVAGWKAADPSNPNADDSAGDIEFYFGSFAEAEAAYLRANRMKPSFLGAGSLLKAAWARLMTGDLTGADAVMSRYVEFRERAKDPRIGLTQAQWLYISGRRQQALREMEALYGQDTVAALAHGQRALWAIASDSRPEALAQAQQALRGAGGDGAARVIAAVTAFLCQPPAGAAEWEQRAGKAFPGPKAAVLRMSSVAYALLLDHEPREAVPVLRSLVAQLEPAGSGAERALLASALVESGALGEARPLLERFPIPANDGIPVFACLYFPRLFEWRAKVLGDTAEGRRSLEIYRKLSQ